MKTEAKSAKDAQTLLLSFLKLAALRATLVAVDLESIHRVGTIVRKGNVMINPMNIAEWAKYAALFLSEDEALQ
jgi:hypothetical protein